MAVNRIDVFLLGFGFGAERLGGARRRVIFLEFLGTGFDLDDVVVISRRTSRRLMARRMSRAFVFILRIFVEIVVAKIVVALITSGVRFFRHMRPLVILINTHS